MPKRVTSEDEIKQAAAARRYGAARGLHLVRAPGGAFSTIDYVAKDSDRMGAEIVEVLEIKCRKNASTTYPTVWAEDRKVASLRKWAAFYSATGVFVAEWSDGVMRRIEVEELVAVSGDPCIGKRIGRDDPLDTDVVYEVPIYRMEMVP